MNASIQIPTLHRTVVLEPASDKSCGQTHQAEISADDFQAPLALSDQKLCLALKQLLLMERQAEKDTDYIADFYYGTFSNQMGCTEIDIWKEPVAQLRLSK